MQDRICKKQVHERKQVEKVRVVVSEERLFIVIEEEELTIDAVRRTVSFFGIGVDN